MARNLDRSVPLQFYVTEEERGLIEQKMALLGTRNMSAYLRKMALDGYVVRMDLPELKELVSLMRYTSNNVNQMARRLNEGGHIYEVDLREVCQNQERLWAAVRSQKFDIVCVTGDVTGRDGDVTAFLKLIDLFQGFAPVYFIPGDEDPVPLLSTPHGYNNAKAEYILRAEAQGAIYLDAPQKIVRGNGVIWLCPEWIYSLDADASETALNARRSELLGQAESEARQAALIAVEYQLDQLRRVREARREITSGDIHIALTHHPLQLSAMENLQEFTQTDNASYVRTVSLVLAGHYVNGQWRLPWVGPVRVPESAGLGQNGWFPGDRGVSGLSYFLGIPQYISPGLGASAAIGLPPFRLFNTPAVTILNLTVKLTQD